MQAFVIGDIHGCLSELKELIKDIDRDATRIILVGDLIDRGKDTEGVIDFVRDNNIECVKGNHEAMAIECLPYLEEENQWALGSSDWFYNGGSTVVAQYSSTQKLKADIKWLQKLPFFIETSIKNNDGLELLVSHAWVTQYEHINKMTENFNFVWNRSQPRRIFDTPYFNIYGHTPVDYLDHKYKEGTPTPIEYEKGMNIDTGCAYDRKGRGWLTGVFFPSLKIKQVPLGVASDS